MGWKRIERFGATEGKTFQGLFACSEGERNALFLSGLQLIKKKNKMCVAKQGCGTSLLWPGNDILSQISQACVPEMLLNRSKVESSVCNGVRMLFCWAPAELLLLFLPPRPTADSLSKQTLSLPWNGKTAFWTDVFMLLFNRVHSVHSCLTAGQLTGSTVSLQVLWSCVVVHGPARCSPYIWSPPRRARWVWLWSKSQEGLTVGQERASVCVGGLI